MSTTALEGRILFDVNGIDWESDSAIDTAARLIWQVATTKGEDN